MHRRALGMETVNWTPGHRLAMEEAAALKAVQEPDAFFSSQSSSVL